MALSKDVTIPGFYKFVWKHGSTVTQTESSYTVKNCYITVSSVNGGKEGMSINVSLKGDDIFIEETYTFVPSVMEGSENFIKQAYEYLKTLPEFADATDC